MAKETAAYMEGTKTVIADSNGNFEVRSGGSRNLRNNNPGNIEYGPAAKELGAVGSDGRFAIFPDADTGTRAMDKILQRSDYQNAPGVPSQGINSGTIGAAIYRWAPPNENDSSSYVAFIEKQTGMSVNTPMSSLSSSDRKKVIAAISYYEGHSAPTVTKSKNPDLTNDFNSFKEKVKNTTTSNKILMSEINKRQQYYNEVALTTTNDIVNFINNDSNFQQNILDNFDNVSYNIKLWLIPEEELKYFTKLSDIEQAKYNFKNKTIIIDTTQETKYSIDNLTIRSVIGTNERTKKTLPVDATFDIIEPNGCSLIDDIKWNMYALGYLDHLNTPLFLEIDFVGYNNQDHSINPLSPVIITDESNRETKVIISLVINSIKVKIDGSGSKYMFDTSKAPIAFATSKDYFNFSKRVEVSKNITTLSGFIKAIIEELNKASKENSLRPIVESGLLPNNKIYLYDISELDEDPPINLNIISNSGESSNNSAKYVIEPGTSLEKIMDDVTCALQNNKTLSVTDEDIVIESDKWPWLYRIVPKTVYYGQVDKTNQKAYQITYKIKKYFNDRIILSKPKDFNHQTEEMFKLKNKIGLSIIKKYDYVFTSKNSQILSLNIDLDCLWTVSTYDNIAIRNNDDTGSSIIKTTYGEKQNILNIDKIDVSSLDFNKSKTSQLMSRISDPLKAIEEKNQMCLDMSNPKNQTLVLNELTDASEIIKTLPKAYRYSSFEPTILPATNNYIDTNMTHDVVENTDIKALSSFAQLYTGNDLINQTMTIRGDPYWLCDPETQEISGEYSYIFNMKTPARRQSGENEDMSPEYFNCSSLWGVFNILEVKHIFKQGKFTQDIKSTMNPNFRFPI